MHTGIFWQGIYWLSLPALAILTIVLARRGLAREFLLFFFYVVSGVLVDSARLMTYRGPRTTYFYVYWISDIISTVFALLATCELALRRLFPEFQRILFYRYLFASGGFIIAVCAAFTAIGSKTVMYAPVLIRTLHTIDFLRVAVLLFFVALMLFMGRRWERYEFGIALGLGVNAAAWLAALTVLTKYLNTIANDLPVIAYDTACIIWLIAFLRPEEQSSPTAPINPELLQEAKQWERTLRQSVTGKKNQ